MVSVRNDGSISLRQKQLSGAGMDITSIFYITKIREVIGE
jgi:hypothetical protein